LRVPAWGNFLLVDDDLFFPDNLVRHDLDWRDVGTHKADSVARRIKLVNPAAECSNAEAHASADRNPADQSKASSRASQRATRSSTQLRTQACSITYAPPLLISKKPMVWAEVFGGGFGGLIARYRPSREPDPASMRRAIENWCADQGKVLPRPAHRYGGEPDAPAIADDADVTVIAGHAARMAIDLLSLAIRPSFHIPSI
jgi:sulfur-carrier protein adenylyltransferase/sulfurtransferase